MRRHFQTDSMVGDVNLFFNDADDPHAAEIEIMIAGNHKCHLQYIRFILS